jgi:cobalt-zinc-cadmium efflux system outer membrane protein
MNLVRHVPLISCAFLITGCQPYSRAPLDLTARRVAVEARDLSDAGVLAYARRFESPPGGPSDPYDPADGLTIREAEVVALFFNPQLRLARLRANVPRVGAAEAGRWEDPELGIDGERIVESVRHPWVLAGTLNFTVPLSGRLGVEKEKANAEFAAEELRVLAEERRVLAQLRVEWVEWSVAGERASLTRQFLSELAGVMDRAERLRAAGELGPVDARLFQIESAKATARLNGLEAVARAAEVRLKSRLGLVPAADVTLVPSVPGTAVRVPAEDGWEAALAANPRIRVARAEYEVAERALKLEVRRQYPDLKLGGGFGTDEGDERILFGAALPLPLFNANRRAIAEARAAREVARAAAEAEYEHLHGEVAAARAELEGARARVEYVERELAPLADRQVEDALRLGRAGEFNTLVLLEALKAAHEAKLEVLDARLGSALARKRLEALLDAGVTATSPPGKDHP